jgi:hypothetical protein
MNDTSGTGGKIYRRCFDTDGAPSLANISENFQKFQNDPTVIFRSWGGGGEEDS